MKQAVRSVLAVIGGVIATVGTVMVATLFGVLLLFGGDMDAAPTTGWLVLNLSYSAAAAVLGGWLAGRISVRAPVRHGLAVAAVLLAMGLSGGNGGAATGAAETAEIAGAAGPGWYGPVLLVIGPLGAAVGALLHLLRRPPVREDEPAAQPSRS